MLILFCNNNSSSQFQKHFFIAYPQFYKKTELFRQRNAIFHKKYQPTRNKIHGTAATSAYCIKYCGFVPLSGDDI